MALVGADDILSSQIGDTTWQSYGFNESGEGQEAFIYSVIYVCNLKMNLQSLLTHKITPYILDVRPSLFVT
jgi:hypothetical protein